MTNQIAQKPKNVSKICYHRDSCSVNMFQSSYMYEMKCRCVLVFVDHGAVGLVSFPGSGNTWVRHLLQLATGICRGEREKNGLRTYCTIACS